MKRLCKHEKTAVILFIISILLMFISLCPGGWPQATGLLQGLSTGLLSGMVLLLITGIKEKERKQLSDICNFWIEANRIIIRSDKLYSALYHRTYHRKKDTMTFNEYLIIIDDAYCQYTSLCTELTSLDRQAILPKYGITEFDEFLNSYKTELKKIRLKIDSANNQQSKAELNEAREMFYEFHNDIHTLYQMISQQILQIQIDREHIESSFL